jgi:hypothetical protein
VISSYNCTSNLWKMFKQFQNSCMLMSRFSMPLLKVLVRCTFSVDLERQEKHTCTKLFAIAFNQQEQLYCVLYLAVFTALLPSGRIAHLTFHISIDTLDMNSLCNISKQDKHAKLLHAIDLIIWTKRQCKAASHIKHLIELSRTFVAVN